MPNFPAAILKNHDNDSVGAYQTLSNEYLKLEQQFVSVWASRFFEISQFEPDSEICLRQVTEEQISYETDMADCLPDFHMRRRFYVDYAGKIHPLQITAKGMEADGKIVGFVHYTNH